MAENLEHYPDRVAEFYKDKTIFITGGTGLMGKVLIEKLLRSCGDLKRIILMVRIKKDKRPKERVREMAAGPLFSMVKEQKGDDIINKVDAVFGDAMLPNLGICKEDREMLINEVEIIFHLAASVRFDEPLKRAVLLNTRCTKYMLELAKECKKLLCFAHMSTAYCHLNERILYEKPYPPPANPHSVIETVEWISDDVIDTITPQILGDIPNTYTFSKALSESLVDEQRDKLPVIILRPSVVIPIWLEPLPGWTDNINGPTGLLIGAGKGVIRTMYCKSNNYADYLPVDVGINGTIVSVYNYMNFDKSTFVYHLTSSAEHKISMEDIINMGRKVIETRTPLNWVAWYPGGTITRSRVIHVLRFLFFQLIPAVLVDALLLILGYKPVLCKVQKRIWNGYKIFEYYANNQWDFDTEKSYAAREVLNPRERLIYKCDGNGVNYFEYFTQCVHAARLYILKETDDTLPAARRHMLVMWYVDKLCKTLFFLGVIYYLYQKVFSPLLAAYS